jgi:hypothetical protein
MAFSIATANKLIGTLRTDDFQCNHVVNQVLTGSKLGKRAADYLEYGNVTNMPVAGAVVVGKDGKHVGVFINPLEFIHSSTSQKKVIRAPLSQLPYVFPNGYEIRIGQ